jgi:mannan polymerase II complex MNN10 subunit
LEGQGLWFVAVHNDFLLCHGTGMFFFRNSEWSRHFLDLWWNQTAFVQPFGQSKSGDNDALKHLLDIMPENERNQHIRIPQMQCLFNSNVWKFSWRSGLRLVTVTKTIWQG